MKGLPEERSIRLAQYIVDKNATVRQTAAQFGISKSTVHKDMTQRLLLLNPDLFAKVQSVLKQNKCERHIRGGLATRKKYEAVREHQETQKMTFL